MPFKISKEDARTKSILIEDLTLAAARIDESVDHYNKTVEGLRTPVELAVTKYNELVSKARELVTHIAEEAEQDIGDRDEKWLDTDRGQSCQSWQESWDGIELDDIDYQWPDELEIDVTDYAQELKDLPDEADES
jgi:hypothetical protein